MGTKLPQLNVAVSTDDNAWLRAEAARLGIPVSALIRMAIRHLRSSILLPVPAPEEIQIGETAMSPAPLPVEPLVPAKERSMTRPKSSAQAQLAKPSSSPILNDRQTCSSCEKLLQLTVVDGETVLTDHRVFVRDENHPRGGEHQKCPGSGKAGEGRIIHGAVQDRRF